MKTMRIQRRRAKGWRMPEGVVYVGRGSKWGNPFVVGKHGDRLQCIQLYVGLFYGMLMISTDSEHIEEQRRVIKALQGVSSLRGKTLACWCREDQLCHADVVWHLANQKRLPKEWLPRYTKVG